MTPEVELLWRRTEDAIADGSHSRIAPLLLRLADCAPEASEPWRYAHREMAHRIVSEHPWRAALLTRRLLATNARDDRAWAVLALAQSLMGHYAFAVRAYRRAIRLAPSEPSYLHNLGHLYDAVYDQPHEALPLLRKAAQLLNNDEVLASYAHALARSGDATRAQQLMLRVIRRGPSAAHQELYTWICDLAETELSKAPAATTARRHRRRVVIGGS